MLTDVYEAVIIMVAVYFIIRLASIIKEDMRNG